MGKSWVMSGPGRIGDKEPEDFRAFAGFQEHRTNSQLDAPERSGLAWSCADDVLDRVGVVQRTAV
jgi:hypothetical protein